MKEILRLFLQAQSTLNELFNEELESIKKELADNDAVNESIVDCLDAMTKRMKGLECRLNKLEKEKEDEIHKIYEYMERLENRINGVAEFAHNTDNVVRAICADLDNKRERKENKRNASNK